MYYVTAQSQEFTFEREHMEVREQKAPLGRIKKKLTAFSKTFQLHSLAKER